MRLGGAGKRRDAVEPEIVAALEAAGARVWYLNGAGSPDVLVLWRGRWMPLEIKTAKGKLKPLQVGAPWPVVRTPIEALHAIGAEIVSVTPAKPK
jgi:hypothetical protein